MNARSPPAGSPPPSGSGRKRRSRAETANEEVGIGRERKRTRQSTDGNYTPAATPGVVTTTPRGAWDDDDEEEQVFGVAEQEERAEVKRKEAAIGQLLKYFTPDQYQRFVVHSQCGLDKKGIRSLVNYVLGQSVAPVIVNSMRGAAKVFVGEMVEAARAVQAERDGEGALQPADFREAYRRFKLQHELQGSEKKKLFVR